MKKHLLIADIFIYSFLSVVFFLFFSVIRVNASSSDVVINEITSNATGSTVHYSFNKITFYSDITYTVLNLQPTVNRPFIVNFYFDEFTFLKGRRYTFNLFVRVNGGSFVPNMFLINGLEYPLSCSNLVSDTYTPQEGSSFYKQNLSCLAVFEPPVDIKGNYIRFTFSSLSDTDNLISLYFRNRFYHFPTDSSNESIKEAIDTQTQQAHDDSLVEQELQRRANEEQKKQFDEFMNGSELDDTSKADQSDFDSYSSNEDSLKSVMSSGADFSNVKVNLDSGTNNFVWDLVTRFVQSNSLVFGLVISILSIGIIKLVFNR